GNASAGTTDATPPMAGMNLLTSDAVQGTAVGRRSTLVQDQSDPEGAPTLVPRNFPYGMGIIVPGESRSSLLVYKLLMRVPSAPAPSTVPEGSPRGTLSHAPISPGIADVPVIATYRDPSLEVADVSDPWTGMARDLSARIPGSGMPHTLLNAEPGATSP